MNRMSVSFFKIHTRLITVVILALLAHHSKADGLLCNAHDFLGSIDTQGNARNVVVVGTTAYVSDGEAGLQIFDVSLPSSPVFLGAYSTPGYATEAAVVGNTAYVADKDQGLQIIDVSDLTSPILLGSWQTTFDASHVVVEGSRAYITETSTQNNTPFARIMDTESNLWSRCQWIQSIYPYTLRRTSHT